MNKIFIIGEIGINHNGDLKVAKKIIDIAAKTGCDAVKFQKRNPDICVPEHQKNMLKETPWGDMTYLEYKHRMEFGKKEYQEIDRYCKSKNIEWFASAWDTESQKFMRQFDLQYNKVASAMLTNMDLLNAIAEEQRHTFISTGMSTKEEIDAAVEVFEFHKCPYTIMSCVSTYPCEPEECNVLKTQTLKGLYPNSVGIGYSSHSSGILAPTLAVAIGATTIEVHIVDKRTRWGTDSGSSLEKRGLELMIRDIRNVPKMLGDGEIKVLDSEVPIKKKLRG